MEIPTTAPVSFDEWKVTFGSYEDWDNPAPLPPFQFYGMTFGGLANQLNQPYWEAAEMLDIIAIGVKAMVQEMATRSGRDDVWLNNYATKIVLTGPSTYQNDLDFTPEEEPEQEPAPEEE